MRESSKSDLSCFSQWGGGAGGKGWKGGIAEKKEAVVLPVVEGRVKMPTSIFLTTALIFERCCSINSPHSRADGDGGDSSLIADCSIRSFF